jgi:hypothetical protein
VIKGVPGLSRLLAVERPEGSTGEELRKATIHVIAIVVGTALAAMSPDQLTTVVGAKYGGFWAWLLAGAMAGAGSDF